MLDQQQHVLLVKPTAKAPWEIPGGMVEENEAPDEACRREISEELGPDITPGHLLSVGYLPANDRPGHQVSKIT